jgi:pyrroline-5-carboxylate reductase
VTNLKIGFIGLGNMAGAIIRGLRKSETFAQTPILGFDLDHNKDSTFKDGYQVRIMPDAAKTAQEADVLVLAIKPQGMNTLLTQIKPVLRETQLILTIAAGKSLRYYAERIGENIPIVQVMPNVNAKVGASVTALCANSRVTEAMKEQAKAVFSAVGTVNVLPEHLIGAFSAIGGAAPAFVYLFIDALASAGIKAGMPRAMAEKIAAEMVEGSARLVLSSSEHPRALVDLVTSPGGTTIEGVHKLAALGFENAVHEAVKAVIDKNTALES